METNREFLQRVLKEEDTIYLVLRDRDRVNLWFDAYCYSNGVLLYLTQRLIDILLIDKTNGLIAFPKSRDWKVELPLRLSYYLSPYKVNIELLAHWNESEVELEKGDRLYCISREKKYDIYVFKNEKAYWLNPLIREHTDIKVNNLEYLCLPGTGYSHPQEIVERFGIALFHDERAFKYETV